MTITIPRSGAGLGVDGLERERRLARAAHAGEHDELVARNFEADVFQIVLARAANDDFVGGHDVGSFQ